MKTHTARSHLAHVVAALLLCASVAVHAGSAPSSVNSLPGYFLGVYLEPYSDSKLLANIQTVCGKKGRLWALGNSNVFRCYGMTSIQNAGEGMVYKLDIATDGSPDRHSSEALENTVFSLKPFPAYEWKSRPATEAEIQRVSALFGKNKEDYKTVRDSLVSGNARVLDSPDKNKTLFIILLADPSGVPEDSDVTDEKQVNPTYAAVVREGNQYRAAGEIVGEIENMVDLDGDGLPELVVNMSCDGTCLTVITLKKRDAAAPQNGNAAGSAVMSIMNH